MQEEPNNLWLNFMGIYFGRTNKFWRHGNGGGKKQVGSFCKVKQLTDVLCNRSPFIEFILHFHRKYLIYEGVFGRRAW